MATKDEEADPILRRLDTIIKLQARIAVAAIPAQLDKVMFLNEIGMGPTAISDMLGITIDSAKSFLKRGRKANATKSAHEK